ncbi:protein involved in polysaccharide export, contains SLBB domain of the beta-grasp fold [Chitinophaga niabensis]|uniref:Protein involved in polysaccharide export, contains SLBB domain of the beta-grasp fold n=2 Tax=Chitinophaga niabensis TaxID=536979 RepID=A0A1N6JY73_9BACT|nr:protein involved in polysaccharide export, contains SLBB domain of the beta-grasp fold [Chitinophaga niabensis]
MKVDDLSDEQVRQIVAEMKRNKVSLDQIDSYAQQKGIPADQVLKLKDRIRALNLEKEFTTGTPTNAKLEETERTVDNENIISARDVQPMSLEEKRRMKIFGAELFSNKNLTFEPNLRMATPPNYRLAAGDELVIDVYGYSEVQHKLKVSPEGYVRIPYLGPVYVNGLTMEEATTRITKQLGTIYGGIKSGNTFVQISLGTIRSIKVLLIGEIDRPGSYTLPSLATVANALYVSGGPNENGSFRDIQVIRNGAPIARFDLYDFLTNGDLTNNIVLQDQDIVKVNPYKTRVELVGEIKRPAIFEAKDNESLQDILNFAGGYTDKSLRDMLRATRINNKEREVVNIPAEQIATFKLRSGDKIFVDSVLNRYSNRITITGAVFHEGEYALEGNMTVADLIKKAGGVKEEASLSRAVIFRLKEDYTPSGSSFNVQDALSGKQTIALQREDSVVIYSKLGLREDYQVKISGQVNAPGYFNYADSLHLEDLILMAGGLRDAASLQRVEVSRRIRGKTYSPNDSTTSIVAQFDLSTDMSAMTGYALQPFDEVVVRKSPTYSEQASVSIDGEVVYPGAYTINSKREKISDVMKRAGGLRPEAYAEGAVLLRKTFVNASDSAFLDSKLQVYYNKMEDSTAITKMQSAVSRKEQLLGINLQKILAQPGSKFDLLLEEGDIIKIPKKLQTVQLFGEVYFPKKVRFDNNIGFREYINGAGGFTNGALKRRSYIVYANGEVKSTRKVLFFNRYPKVKPGAEIYVPAKKESRGLSGQEALGITTGIASLALIIVTVLDKIK